MGGLGKRLGNHTTHAPKSMVPVHGKPFFCYSLELLKAWGFKDFVFCVGYHGEVVENFFGDGSKFGVAIRYSQDGDKPLGTGGALKKAEPLLADDFLLMYGDSFMDIDYAELIYEYERQKKEHKVQALMTIYKNQNHYDRSNIVFKGGQIVTYDKEKSSSEMEHIDYGVSILNRAVVHALPTDTRVDLTGLYQTLIAKHQMGAYETLERFHEIGTPAAFEAFKEFVGQRVLVQKKAVILDRDGTLNEPVWNEKTKELDSPLHPEELKLVSGVVSALKELKKMGYLLFVATNQPAAAKGKATLRDLYAINRELRETLKKEGVELQWIFMCPHHPIGCAEVESQNLVGDCDCRKPKAGMLECAIEKYGLDRGRSFMVGDAAKDVLAGQAAGIQTILIGNEREERKKFSTGQKPDHAVKNLAEFVEYLQKHERALR